ncbi:hypothetical protein M011DRAFT_478732 [Sporormia fimetaria CBS 119925]|uniref:UBA domain-containing protein n=1 Tax=Sporormia fimetaria CBS 119925 TaxID=1340428 RepID=A0A6A6V8W5_9PLEO|nr:hypothetical protein M011DRAFT_478732 [Sporormia fimetaria CBS 119925]
MQFPELQGTIGVYKDGRIQWEKREQAPTRDRRPQIQVIIPDDSRNRPLPTSPFFGQIPFSMNKVTNKVATAQGNSHIRSASAEYGFTQDDVSPPSDSKGSLVRDSTVSPLNERQRQAAIHSHAVGLATASPRYVQDNKGKCTPPLCNSSDESHEDDASSTYTKRSSMSSVAGDEPHLLVGRYKSNDRTPSAFGIRSPVEAGIFEGGADKTSDYGNSNAETGPQPPHPTRPRHYGHHHIPIEQDAEFMPTCSLRPLRTSRRSLQKQSALTRNASKRISQRRSPSADANIEIIQQAIDRTASAQHLRNIPSPTLSEAENDLEEELTSYANRSTLASTDAIYDPPQLPDYAEAAPALPRRSSRRQSPVVMQAANAHFRLSRVPGNHIASQLQRTRSLGRSKGLRIDIPNKAHVPAETPALSPIPVSPQGGMRAIAPDAAENVILCILRSLESLDDLFSTAVVNRGFYRVFKRHELDLMKRVLRRMSPAAWEHRELCYPGHDIIDEEEESGAVRLAAEYTPSSYIQHYTRDVYIIAALKGLIREKCQSFARSEMAAALMSVNPPDAARVDDALWRIWTFCKIFGSGKGREDDIVAQMDWLRGGVLVHQNTCTFSILTTESIDMNSTLASAPDCFAKGNPGGLTAEELFDMMELWVCLGVLLQPLEGRTVQARECGIYENTDVRGGDIDGEEMMLDEWYYYLLTLGLSPILDLAGPCQKSDNSAFTLAVQNGWINWSPPVFGGTRRNFLKEAASRVYEDKIAVTYAESSTKEVQRQLSKQRIQRHIIELRQQKHTSGIGPLRMSQERPISEWENVLNNLTRPRPPASTSNLVSHIPTLRGDTQYLAPTIPELPATRTPSPDPDSRGAPTRTVAQPLLPTPPPSTVPSIAGDRTSSIVASMPPIHEHPAFRSPTTIPELPGLEDHPAFRHQRTRTGLSAQSTPSSHPSEEHPALQQHRLQHDIFGSDRAENTAEKAVYRIVEMGFTADEARNALKVTDMGDGLRVDRAVEFLLRGH